MISSWLRVSPGTIIGLILAVCAAVTIKRFPNYRLSVTRICSNPFYVTSSSYGSGKAVLNEWPCYVRPPPGYQPPYGEKRALWEVPRKSLGELNTSSELYNLHINHQLWAEMGEETVTLTHKGGTSGRAFKENFEYVQLLLRKIAFDCEDPGIILDTGAGIGSVAAAMMDERGGDGKMRVIGYVLPDDYLRLQAIMSLRKLPSFLHNFNGTLPFPRKSVDVVHCKWCWHHLGGYDVWLKEVNRVLRPGGVFVFTFEGKGGELLDWNEWEGVLNRTKFKCERVRRIVLVCRKKGKRYCPTKLERKLTSVENLNEILRRRNSSFSRRLAIECRKDCLSLGKDVVHMGKNEDMIKQLLQSGIAAWLGDTYVPVYPRSFDLVFVPCEWREWEEVHRVLRPGGVAVRFGCGGTQRGFLEEEAKNGISLAWRVDV